MGCYLSAKRIIICVSDGVRKEEDGRSPEKVILVTALPKECVGGEWMKSREENAIELK